MSVQEFMAYRQGAGFRMQGSALSVSLCLNGITSLRISNAASGIFVVMS